MAITWSIFKLGPPDIAWMEIQTIASGKVGIPECQEYWECQEFWEQPQDDWNDDGNFRIGENFRNFRNNRNVRMSGTSEHT